MTGIRERKYLLVVFALALALVGCKGESPTAPTSGGSGGSGSGGGVTPPVGATVSLAVSNANPLVDSTATVTATVSQNSAPVANGTAVEFTTNLGTFSDTGTTTTIRTTTGGVATATLTSSVAGTATVIAVVNNVTRSATVNFVARPVTPTPPDLTPTITSVSPTTGRPQGGDTLVITGTNFRAPVRVLFDTGSGTPKEAFVVSVTPTRIEVLTPPVDLGAGQTLSSTISVFNEAGTAAEIRVNAGSPFVFTSTTLTPKVTAASPASGPATGGTRVTLFGEGFQAPLQVFFGTAEAQVLNVTFSQIIVVAPPSRDTSDDGATSVSGQVDVKVVNINSGTTTTFSSGFKYTPAMAITAVGPTEGLFTGGTRVTIDGTGFDDPVAVTVATVAAQPIRVSGTQLIVLTSPVAVSGCADVTGPIAVTNVETGISADGGSFTYRVPKPIIIAVTQNTTVGGSISVTVANAAGFPRLTVGDVAVNVTGTVVNGDGTTTYTGTIPSTVQLNTVACAGAGASAPIPTALDVIYTSATTGCTNTLTKGTIVSPVAVARATYNPNAYAAFTARITPASAGPPATPATVTPSTSQVVTLSNTGSAPLSVTSVSSSGAGCAAFSLPSIAATSLEQCDALPLSVTYNGTTAPATHSCTLTVTTSVGVRNFTLTGTSQ
jgi:large repetitive protein